MGDNAGRAQSIAGSSHPMEWAVAGFWVRFAAVWLDVAILSLAILLAKAVLAGANTYVPFELSLILALIVYNTALVAWKRTTLGKMLCGLTVRRADGRVVGIWRVLVRETLGKFISLATLSLGYLWIGFSRHKRGWHDRIAGTHVVRTIDCQGRARYLTIAVLTTTLAGFGLYIWEMAGIGICMKRTWPPADTRLAYMEREASELTDTSSIPPEDEAELQGWIALRGKSPIEYAVEKAREHQVVIFGESHERKMELRYLNDLVPELYRQAGVTCVAMEVCLAEDNERIEKLVTASEFDRDLALQIARHQPWGIWGWKGYWDIFETVWRINQEIAAGEENVRVIGLDRRMDMPSLAMMGVENNAGRDAPVWEKLRLWRLLLALPRVLSRDAFFAFYVEKEIIQKGRRGIVWVGRNHSSINSPQIVSPERSMPRMGFILHSRYGDKVFQIRLHGWDIPASAVSRDYAGPKPAMGDFLERIMGRREGSMPVGFDIEYSPFSLLRDNGSFEYHSEPRLGFVDVASGYVFLAKRRELAQCNWLPGYVSQEMFVANRPFYQAIARRAGEEANSARDINDLFSQAR